MSKKGYSFTKSGLLWLVIALGVAYFLSLTVLKNGIPLPVSFYLVQSGSMEPAINTGDIVVVKPQASYADHVVITFYDADNRVITHRILKSNHAGKEPVFTTKGDANESADAQAVPKDKVIGKVVFILPKIGFLVSFAKTRYGALLLIIVPAVIIIYDEFKKMQQDVS